MPTAIEAESAVETLLAALVAEVKGLRADFHAVSREPRSRSGTKSLSREDRGLLGRLLPAIGGALGSDPFLARDLFEHPSAALRLVLRGLNTKRIGRLFQRAEGQVVDGYVIERAGDELHTNLWRVVEVPGSPLPVVPPRTSRGLP